MTMIILWSGKQNTSLERCVMTTNKSGVSVQSVILGEDSGRIYKVRYKIQANRNWQTKSVAIESVIGNLKNVIKMSCNAGGNWTLNGETAPAFAACTDIDISLSPFTNTLPINRLQLETGNIESIHVVYFDLLEQKIKPVAQRYNRLSATHYKFEQPAVDFKAIIDVDTEGFVVDYPGLFSRVACERH